mmetsp:Transcript_38835/g.76355  ORF Transcript_38835/g.76355 Transcript_38835/m.76355 type:complete len:329 (-) Transcript_38835:440-1426(-)
MINLPTLISLCVLAFCVGVSNGSPSALPVTKKTSTLPPPSNPEIAQTVECPMPCGPDKCCGYYPDMCNWHSVDGYSCLSDAEEEEEEEETPTEEPPAEEEGEEEEGAGEEEEEEGTTTPAPVEEMTPPEDLTFGRVSSDSCPMPCGTEGCCGYFPDHCMWVGWNGTETFSCTESEIFIPDPDAITVAPPVPPEGPPEDIHFGRNSTAECPNPCGPVGCCQYNPDACKWSWDPVNGEVFSCVMSDLFIPAPTVEEPEEEEEAPEEEEGGEEEEASEGTPPEEEAEEEEVAEPGNSGEAEAEAEPEASVPPESTAGETRRLRGTAEASEK